MNSEKIMTAQATDANTCEHLSRKSRFCVDKPFIGKVLSLGVCQGQALDIGCGPGHRLDVVVHNPRLSAPHSTAKPPMRTRRPIAINNSLSHGICNCNCTLCGVNKPGYKGPKEFQPKAVTETLVVRIKDAARQGLLVRYVANAGDGEPTLHPEFGERMDMFGAMIRMWDVPDAPTPEVAVVTNGVRLMRPGVLDAFTRNPLTLIVSFPTPDPESYGMLMTGDPRKGPTLLKHVVPGIRQALRLHAQGRIRRVQFHISPPERDVVRRDFDRTLRFLATLAREEGVETVEAILFPATANRSGLIRSAVKGCDMYGDLIRRYSGKRIGGVHIRLHLTLQRFFPRLREFYDLLRAYDFPCTWNAQLFVTAAGDSTCCNDQAVRNPMGNLLHASLPELMANKERHRPGRVCAGCNQRPNRIVGPRLFTLFGWLSMLKLRRAEAKSTRTVPGLPALETDGL